MGQTVENRLRKVVPGRRPFAGEMKDASDGAAVSRRCSLRNPEERRRKLSCRGRISLLIANDPYNRPRFG